jgi:hypothetical protein
MRQHLALLAGDELPRRHIPAVERHLAACAGCRQFLAELRATRQRLAGLGTAPLPPEALARLHQAVLGKLATDGGSASGRYIQFPLGVWLSGWRLAGVVTAALLLAAGLGVWWLNRAPEAPAPGPVMVQRAESLPAVPSRPVPDLPALRPEAVAPVETAQIIQPLERPAPATVSPAPAKPVVPTSAKRLARSVPSPAVDAGTPAPRPDKSSGDSAAPPRQTLVKMTTEDPNVVIFWILEKKGEDIS